MLEAVRDLGVTVVRYPGGNFVSGYRWQDGVGPVAARPARLDLAWHSLEPNTFGVDEFMAWAKLAGVAPMMAVNLGTRGIQDALDLLEYCNVPGGTALSDTRRANGSPEPYKVTMWCLGNEMDGPWQIGHKTADEYGRLASQTAKAMRMIDPGLELVACGSSGPDMPGFGTWERTVLEHTYDDVDYLSAHSYYQPVDGDMGSFLASAVELDRFLDSIIATCDHVRAERRATKRIMISLDEWNVWYKDRAESVLPSGDDWPVAPHLLEDRYSVADAVVVGDLLISLLRHADRVRAACLAQLVNVIAPIVAEAGGPVWRQTIFYPFALTARYARGTALDVSVASDTYESAAYGDVPLVDASATVDDATGEVALFMVNRSTTQPAPVTLRLNDLGVPRLIEAVELSDGDFNRPGSLDGHAIVPKPLPVAVDEHGFGTTLPPVSWSMIRLRTSR